MKKISWLVLLFVPSLYTSASQDPNLERGVNSYAPYSFSEIDNVNLFNGNVSIRIPLSLDLPVQPGFSYSLVLTHNSRIWDYESAYSFESGSGETVKRRAIPENRSNAGMGWRISLGELVPRYYPGLPATTAEPWIYVGPDGSESSFGNEEDPVTAETSDGNYLKLVRDPADPAMAVQYREVLFPDGVIKKFDPQGRLLEIRDRAGNWVRVAYQPYQWIITNGKADSSSAVRTHRINFIDTSATYNQPNFQKLVSSVEVSGFSSSISTYTFTYDHQVQVVRAACDESDGVNGDSWTVSVPLLNAVSGPDGFSYSFQYDTSSEAGCGSGFIKTVILPTKGRIDYDFDIYELATESCDPNKAEPWVGTYPGVISRKLSDRNGASLSTTTYTPELIKGQWVTHVCGGQNLYTKLPSDEFRNSVVTAEKLKTIHYFSAHRVWDYPGVNRRGEYGLPMTRRVEAPGTSGTRFLSSELFDCSGTCLSTAEETRYVNYEVEPPVETFAKPTNARVQGNRTVYNQDNSYYIDVNRTFWDGFGHYRGSTTTSNFPDNPFQEVTHFTNYTPDASSRLLGLYDYQSTTLKSADGTTSTLRTDIFFDTTLGLPLRQRSRRNTAGTAPLPSSSDVIVEYVRNSEGNVTDEKYYGGDLQSIGTGALASLSLPGTPENWSTHQYTYGTRSYSAAVDPSSGAEILRVLDATIDQGSGLPISVRDAAGVQTTLLYDAMSRLTEVRPTGGAWTEYRYTPASSQPARVDILQRPEGTGSGAAPLTESMIWYDSFGQPVVEQERMPDGSWSFSRTHYDAKGRVARKTVRERSSVLALPDADSQRFTEFEYDALDRVKRVIVPDEAQTVISYLGIRQKTLTTLDNLDITVSSATGSYDAAGRLVKVEESDGDGQTIAASYTHDAGDRVRSVSVIAPDSSGALRTQNRTFQYDGLGRLRYEIHPEMVHTVDGSERGAIVYTDYDSRGNAHKRCTEAVVLNPLCTGSSLFDLRYTFDGAGRLTETWSRNPYYGLGSNPEFRISERNVYGITNQPAASGQLEDRRAGKLISAERYNYDQSLGIILVRDSYEYRHPAGLMTLKSTDVEDVTGNSETINTFDQDYQYDQLGALSTIRYPECFECGVGGISVLSMNRTRGMLTSIPGFVDSVTYHPSGAYDQIDHGNGMTVTQQVDPSGMVRPHEIAATSNPECLQAAGIPESALVEVPEGQQATLRVTGYNVETYQWQTWTGSSWQDVYGETTDTYLTPPVFGTETYRVHVANFCSESHSDPISVEIECDPPTITQQPASQTTIAYGATTTISVTATADEAITYTWYEGAPGDTSVQVATGSSFTTPALENSTAYWVKVTVPCGESVNSTKADVIVKRPTPTGVLASQNGPGEVIVGWSGSPGSYYQIQRRGAGTGFVTLPGADLVATSPWTDTTVMAATAYAYQVVAVDGSGGSASDPSNADLVTMFTFAEPLVPQQTLVRAAHLSELRDAVDLVRAAAGLGPYQWSPAPTHSPILADHLTNVRSILNQARQTLGVPPVLWTDQTIVPQQTIIQAQHWTEIREAME